MIFFNIGLKGGLDNGTPGMALKFPDPFGLGVKVRVYPYKNSLGFRRLWKFYFNFNRIPAHLNLEV